MEDEKKPKKTKTSPMARIPLWARRPYMVAILAFVGGFLLAAFVWWLIPKGQQIDSSQYQAVYLANGQMYFGKLQNTEGTYLYMKSPYMPQSTTDSSSQTTDATTGTIVRVKNQLWGPEDSIAIRADQVAFWQNLRNDSKVTQAIEAKE